MSVALALITSMLKAGDLGPIHRGEFRKEHCMDAASVTLFEYLSSYRRHSGGVGHVPAEAVIKARFPHLQLPDVAPIIDLPGLVYEARTEKTRIRVQELASRLAMATKAADPIGELRTVRTEFDMIMRECSVADDLSFADSAHDILSDYTHNTILRHGIPWPWETLTRGTQGIQKGEFYIVAGRPKSRKTFIALYIAAYLVRVHGARVLFISPEMPARQVMLRFVAFLGEVHYAQFKQGSLSAGEEDKLFTSVLTLLDQMQDPGVVEHSDDNLAVHKMPGMGSEPDRGGFVVAKATGQPVTFIESKIQEHRPHVVIVDSFYRLGMAGGSKTYDSDWKVITSVSRMLKDMSMDHKIGLIGTHQLNRDADEKIGSLANMGYSDAIGQDCDMAMRVITAKRRTGDKSALIILGARETDIEGVLINNVPCSDFSEIEPLVPGNRSKLLTMLSEEETSDAVPSPTVTGPGTPKGFGRPRPPRVTSREDPNLPMAGVLAEQMLPSDFAKKAAPREDSDAGDR